MMVESHPSRSLVLASASPHRRKLLQASGIVFDVEPADIDESSLKRTLAAEKADGPYVASALARAKAETISAKFPDAVVIGADQVLTCEGEFFDKPGTTASADAQLRMLRGKTHQLHSGVALALSGASFWQRVDSAVLTMRAFSDAFLKSYLERAGKPILGTVGAYEIEGIGIQLFDAIEGDSSTIIGLPLLPLLAELRAQGFVET